MTLQLGGGGAITGCTSLQEPALTLSGLTVSGPLDVEKIIVSSGTAAAPTYTFSGDTDNGLYYAGTNSIGLATNGTNAILIDSTGKVGIGTTSPAIAGLTIENAGVSQGLELEASNGFAGGPTVRGYYRSGSAYKPLGLTGSEVIIGIQDVEKMRIDSSGRVAIGVTNPGHQLTVKGTGSNTAIANFFGGSVGRGLVIATNNDGGVGDDTVIYNATQNSGSHVFQVDASEKMRIDSSGRLLVGTSTARAVGGESNSRLQIEGSGGSSNSWVNISRFADSAGSAVIQFGKSRSDTPGTYTVVQNNDTLGSINFAGADGTDLATYGAKIAAEVDGTPGTNDMPGRLTFWTTADGASSLSERMRIDSSGRVGINTSSPLSDAQLTVSDSDAPAIAFQRSGSGKFDAAIGMSGNSALRFYIGANSDSIAGLNEAMQITHQGYSLFSSTGSYYGNQSPPFHSFDTGTAQWTLGVRNTSTDPYGLRLNHGNEVNNSSNHFIYASTTVFRFGVMSNGGIANYQSNNSNLCDEREKKNIEPLDSTWNCLKNWELKKFHYNEADDTEDKKYGVIAQQIAPHCPEVISEWVKQIAEDAVLDEDGNIVTPAQEEITRMGVKEQQMMWIAIKALQEAMTRIETLEQRLTDAGSA